MKNFFRDYNEFNMKNANKFVSYNCRGEIRNYYYRSAILKYFEYKDMDPRKLIKVKYIKGKKRPGSFMPKWRVTELIDNITNERMRLAAKLQLFTGRRASEILKLRWIDLRDDKIVNIKDSKANKYHTKPIPEKLFKDLDIIKQKIKDKSTYLFFDGKIKDASLFRRYYNHIKRAGKIIGADNFATHDLRRNYAKYMLEKYEKNKDTRSLEKTSKQMGHSTIEQTRAYLEEILIDDKEMVEEVFDD
jgi:integrase